jgi:hypothetical protein
MWLILGFSDKEIIMDNSDIIIDNYDKCNNKCSYREK